MLDGWEMQVKSEEDNTNHEEAYGGPSIWTSINCGTTKPTCTKQPGGYLWQNSLGGFVQEKMFEVGE